ncbi:BTAD domain-containing putative transcriptional regulator [Actinoplanes sp. NPDC051475]|uniref:BTAD domain-containing putative transcriptional regulator n=1 Tax=Actinoplanes sp. NPDC051475 TaxID=3157225 RepID=UPI00344B4EC0
MQELRLLGPVEVCAHNGFVHAGEPRRLAVLAALTVDAGRVVSTTTLIDRVWGDKPPGQATRTLGTYITRIRRVLEQAFSDSAVTVINQPGGYRLTVRHDQVDLFRFRDLVVQARAPSCTPERRVDLLRQAVSLHRGDPLTGVDGAWAMRTREHLTGELLTARAEWAEAELAVDNAMAVLAPLSTLADANPLVEPLVVALVRALVAAGRPTEALERCRLHRQRLADGYGTDPSPQLMALYETVLRADQEPVGATPVEPSELPSAWALRERTSAPPAPALPTAAVAVATEPVVVDAGSRIAGESRAATSGADRPVPVTSRRWRRRPLIATCALFLTLTVAIGAVALFRPSDRSADSGFSATEDFSGTQLTPMQWIAHETKRENGSSWSPSMVKVSGGELQISGTGRSPTGRGNMAGSVCWCLEGGVKRTYGVWEVRAKFDVGTGYAPVIGLYSDVDQNTTGWGFLTLARLDDGERRTMYPVVSGAGGQPIDGSPVGGDFTAWNTYSIEWRADFVTVSLNGAVIFDTRKLPTRVAIPTVPMYLYVQVIPGPEGSVPAPNQETPGRATTYVDWARYTS